MTALVISVVCLALNAFFVAAEFAMVKARLTQLRPRARRGERRAVAAEAVLTKLDRYLSVTQVGITIASLGLGWIGEPAMERLGDRVAVLVTGHGLGRVGHAIVDVTGLGTLTFLHVLLGELVPKAVAIRHSEQTALTTALPLRVVNVLLWPVLWVMEHAQRGVLRVLHVDPDLVEGGMSEEEIVRTLAVNARRAPRAADRQRTLERVLRFASRPVRHIMIPRVDLFRLPIESSGEHAFTELRRHGFSRVPLFGNSVDDIVGYLYAKDFLFDETARERASLRGLERRILFVPEGRDALGVLREMQGARTPIAVVVDEYGGTSGIVTIEDLVEDVFGEIRDELDVERQKVTPLEGPTARWEVDARATTDELRDAGVPLDDLGPGEPVGRVVLERLAHLPRIGDIARLADAVEAEVIAMKQRRIQRLQVRVGPIGRGRATAVTMGR